jgi:hypothetical protein
MRLRFDAHWGVHQQHRSELLAGIEFGTRRTSTRLPGMLRWCLLYALGFLEVEHLSPPNVMCAKVFSIHASAQPKFGDGMKITCWI